jgi:hypothetical protein
MAILTLLLCAGAYAAGPPPLKINLDEFDAMKKVCCCQPTSTSPTSTWAIPEAHRSF